ncbi:uncharacterized protein LOC119684951 isoform X2 [Teleopsis dalmanni]|uniref:uncharacterized protein LOC119684951 isoform X2 n=1 Tax=Teleopsis dalmanni TaxID=139649 RepID=UPI0018CCDD14|nr:uncharacterized protein LOC119684951 isoform X2 [Teleopsis dalmanni]
MDHFKMDVTETEAMVYFTRYGDIKQLNFYRGDRHKLARFKVGFVNFNDPYAAARVLKRPRHSFKSYQVFVKPCYSWTQPQVEETISTAESQLMEPSYILNLNDDCLLYIFQMLEFRAQLNFARSCDRFKALFLQYNKIKDLDPVIFNNVTIFEAHEFFKIAGDEIINIAGPLPLRDADRYIDMIGKFCRNVESIKFGEIKVSPGILRKWSTNWTKLTKLEFEYCTVNDNCFKTIKQIPNLISLAVKSSSDITGRYIDEMVNLTELSLDGCVNVTTGNLTSIIKKLKDLTKLDIRRCERISTQSQLDYIISKHTKLSELKLSITKLKWILEMPQLTHLEVQNRIPYFIMSNHLFQSMIRGVDLKIEYLSLDVMDAVSLERTKAITNLKNLKYLKIYSSSQLNDECLRLLAENLKQLEVIDLEKCKSITESGLITLVKDCKNLKKLCLKGVKNITETFILNVIKELKSKVTDISAPFEILLSGTSTAYTILQNDVYINSKSLVNVKIDNTYNDFCDELESDYSDSDFDLNSDEEDGFDVWHAIINNFDIEYSDDDDDDYLFYDHDLLDDFDNLYNIIHF